MLFSRAFYLFLMLAILTVSSCKTAHKSTERSSKLPPSRTTPVPYYSDEEIAKNIESLEYQRKSKPTDEAILLPLAAAYLDLGKEEKATEVLEKLVSIPTSEPKVYSSLAAIYKKQLKISEAILLLEEYKRLYLSAGRNSENVDREIDQLTAMNHIMANQHTIQITSMGADINTDFLEYLPQFTIDQKSIVFTRRLDGQEDLFEAIYDENGNMQIRPIDELNTDENEGAHCLSADGQELFFTQCQKRFGYGKCDIYLSTRVGDQWSAPKNIGSNVNTEHWESQPSISANGRILYFASDRPDGFGGSDIWYSLRTDDNKWTKPINAGPVINTSSDEGAPFIHADGKTLYFQSAGHKGLGQQDLFMSKIVDNEWTDPINLSYPINTPNNEGGLAVSLDGLTGYYATDQINGIQLNQLDIVKFEMPISLRPMAMTYVKGRVIAADTKLPIRADIEIVSLTTNKGLYRTKANINGEFLAAVPLGESVAIHIGAPEYLFFSDHLEYKEIKYGAAPYLISVSLDPVEKEVEKPSAPIVLKNIFFKTGSDELLEDSNFEIDYLVKLLNRNIDKRIEIIGHTDNVGTDADNLKLSEARANSVRNALTARGVSPERITAIGKGETEPLATNDTEEGRSLNRRTEFILK